MPYGIVTQTKPGYVKVELPEMEYETEWIPIVSILAYKNTSQFNIPINTQVFILNEYDQYGELINQICVGATYNNEDTPQFSSNKDGFSYEDGAEISYDLASKTFKISSKLLEIGQNASQQLTNLETLGLYLDLVNKALLKIPTPPTSVEITALEAALTLLKQGISSIKTPII